MKNVKKSKGLTLIEAMLTLAIIALFVSTIIMFYLSIKTSREVLKETDNTNRIIAKMEKLFKNNEMLRNLEEEQLTRFIAMQRGFEEINIEDKLVNSWGGNINVVNLKELKRYSIVYHEVPKSACEELIPNFANKVKGIKLNDKDFKDDIVTLTELCLEAGNKIEIIP